MGNLLGCAEGCYTWAKGYSRTLKSLRKLYKTKYAGTIFQSICLEAVKEENQFTHIDSDMQMGSKKSLIDSAHYEQEGLNRSRKNKGLPARFSTLSEEEKKIIVLELIRKSYIFLDMSDIFDGDDVGAYHTEVRQKIFLNDESLMSSSFIEARSDHALCQSLKNFDTSTINQLEKYVEVCEKIQQACDFESKSFLSQLILKLKGALIFHYNASPHKKIDSLFQNTKILIEIVEDTVLELFELYLVPRFEYRNSSNMNQSTATSENQQEYEYNFFNETNFTTLISSIIFSDPNFTNFLENSIIEYFSEQLSSYRQRSSIRDDEIGRRLINPQQKKLEVKSSAKIEKLFESKHSAAPTFQKSIKIFNKLPNKQEPILKLKMIGELEKEYLKEFRKLQNKQNVQIIYDRQVSQRLAKWLINRKHKGSERNIVSIIIAYAFVHPEYRLGSKGSSLISFVEEIQLILGWRVPTL